MRRWRERVRGLVVHGLPPWRAGAVGAAAIGVLALVFLTGVLDEHRPAQALLLVVPVAASAVLGGRSPAFGVAALGAIALTLLSPPRGRPVIDVADDVVALVVYSIVAFVVGGLVAYRIDVLGRVERQRAALLRSVSHDLRTPLGTIQAALSVLQDRSWLDDEERERLLATAAGESEHLDRLVGDLLSLARIEAGALEPRRQAVDVGELIEHALVGVRTFGAPIELDMAADLPLVQADYGLLEQVVRNLVENALRHSPDGTPVGIHATADGDRLLLTVRDEGPGLPAGEEHSIFEPFRTGPTAGASGIGLAICKAVVEAHGGTITAGGRPDRGAQLVVSLPLE